MLNKYINCIMFMEGNSGICGQTPWGWILFRHTHSIWICEYVYVHALKRVLLWKKCFIHASFPDVLSWESTFSVYWETTSLTWMRQAERESERGTVNIWNKANHERQCRSTTGADLYVWSSALGMCVRVCECVRLLLCIQSDTSL